MSPVVENIFEMALKNPYNTDELDRQLKEKVIKFIKKNKIIKIQKNK